MSEGFQLHPEQSTDALVCTTPKRSTSARERCPRLAAARRGKPLPAAVLFDMDGLLIDTEPLWFAVETEILAELGASLDPRRSRHLVGSSAPVASAFIAERSAAAQQPEEIADLLLVRMSEQLATHHPCSRACAS